MILAVLLNAVPIGGSQNRRTPTHAARGQDRILAIFRERLRTLSPDQQDPSEESVRCPSSARAQQRRHQALNCSQLSHRARHWSKASATALCLNSPVVRTNTTQSKSIIQTRSKPEIRPLTTGRPRREFSQAPVSNESGTGYRSAEKFGQIAPSQDGSRFESPHRRGRIGSGRPKDAMAGASTHGIFHARGDDWLWICRACVRRLLCGFRPPRHLRRQGCRQDCAAMQGRNAHIRA
jgi:hypothetical protein